MPNTEPNPEPNTDTPEPTPTAASRYRECRDAVETHHLSELVGYRLQEAHRQGMLRGMALIGILLLGQSVAFVLFAWKMGAL